MTATPARDPVTLTVIDNYLTSTCRDRRATTIAEYRGWISPGG
jgi:hypothetical protein